MIQREALPETLRHWCARHDPQLILLGQGTGASDLASRLTDLPVPLQTVPEHDTTRLARVRYFADHPPRGWRRLLPASLQTPPVPIDDYAAWLIAERFFQGTPVD